MPVSNIKMMPFSQSESDTHTPGHKQSDYCNTCPCVLGVVKVIKEGGKEEKYILSNKKLM